MGKESYAFQPKTTVMEDTYDVKSTHATKGNQDKQEQKAICMPTKENAPTFKR